jgi:hypothetical protein
LSPDRTTTPRQSIRSNLAVRAAAVTVLAAATATTGAWTSGAAAGNAATARPAASLAASSSAHAGQAITLDSFTAALTAAKPQGRAAPDSSTGSHHGSHRRPHRLTPKQIAWRMLRHFHWRHRQFKYLNRLWSRESSWNVHASNPYSGAYGIPQAVPGSKMSSAGPDWPNSARTQIRWGMRYIASRYGSPSAAWAHECATGWY